jgi:hypothetical protein
MIWRLYDLIASAQSNSAYIKGAYIPARPISGFFWLRVKGAWLVLIGKADAVIWPGNQ